MEVLVRAEPKQGAKRAGSSGDYGVAGSVGPMALVDYDALEEIVVWAEPQPPASPGVTSSAADAMRQIDLGKPSQRLRVVLGDVHIGSDRAYVRLEDGSVQPLSPARDSAGIGWTTLPPGYCEIMTDSSERPTARVYVVPTEYAAVAKSGERVRFDGLPPGSWKVSSWHPRLPGSSTTVQLEAGRIATTSATVGVDQLPGAVPAARP